MTDEVPERAAAGDDPAERDAVWQAMCALPLRQRTVLVLRFYEDLPDEEIATILGCRPRRPAQPRLTGRSPPCVPTRRSSWE